MRIYFRKLFFPGQFSIIQNNRQALAKSAGDAIINGEYTTMEPQIFHTYVRYVLFLDFCKKKFIYLNIRRAKNIFYGIRLKVV